MRNNDIRQSAAEPRIEEGSETKILIKNINYSIMNRKDNNMKLNSRELKDFFVGCLLGDANLHFGAFSTAQISSDLIEFKSRVIKDNLPNAKIKVKEHQERIDKNGVRHQKHYSIYVSPNEYFKKLQNEFYPFGKKIVPVKYAKRGLTNLGYAVWYADDGTTIHVKYDEKTGSSINRRVQFCTDNFTLQDVKLLSDMIGDRFGNTSFVRRKEDVFRIQINQTKLKCAQHFINTIAPIFYSNFPSLLYKMDLGYRGEVLHNDVIVTKEYYNTFINISSHSQFIDRLANRNQIN